MLSRDLDSVLDILQAANLIQQFVVGIDFTTFDQDLMRQSVVIRQLEIMGEASKRVSESFKANHRSPNL